MWKLAKKLATFNKHTENFCEEELQKIVKDVCNLYVIW